MADQTEGFYRRPLPTSCIAFSSTEGRQLFREALELGGMDGYFALAEQFHTQAEPAFCGLGTMVVVLNALAIDPGRIWRGIWRWYGEEMLDCCQSLPVIKETGITLDEFVCISRCNGAKVTAHRYTERNLDEFRQDVKRITSTAHGIHMIAAYSRKVLGQTGDGHFSPIGGYHPQRDLVLLLDVARFKYPPHWVPLPLLWEAFEPPDPETNRSRGYILLQKTEELYETCFHVALNPQQWCAIAAPYFEDKLPNLLKRADSLHEVVTILLKHFPSEFASLLQISIHSLDALSMLRKAIQANPLFEIAQQAVLNLNGGEAIAHQWDRLNGDFALHKVDFTEWLTLLLLSCPPTLYKALRPNLETWFEQIRNPVQLPEPLNREVTRLQEQMSALQEFWGTSNTLCQGS
ncbi:MAG: phytochelatin synthase family protein [Oscillatoriophycideae cyanobacterium NC_groundwater_1537_Pr4_S-0.65um_50_18]|nr:phytochelatin synthase family protein [Oscillatoriophycideae cyanobacterium NC_groundwater_1537_Pr4_S-0.65um_50_18]